MENVSTEQGTSVQQPAEQTQVQPEGERQAQGGFDLANRMAELMRRERALQQREQQWKGQGDKLKKLEALENAQSIDDKLAAIGLDYSAITKHYLTKSNDDHVEELKRRLEQVEGKTNQAFEQLSQRQLDEMQQRGISDINVFLEGTDEFPLTRALGEQDTIWHMVTSHYQSTGETMTYADAAKLIEQELQKKLGNLKSHKETDWFKRTLGFDDEPGRKQGSEKPAGERITGGQPAIVHNMLNAYRGETPSSLGALESGNATSRTGANKSDAELRNDAIEFLRKLRQG